MERVIGTASKGGRRPAVAKPGAKASERPTPQKGGGGNKGTSTAPVETVATVPVTTVSEDGTVTVSNVAPKRASRVAAKKAHKRALKRAVRQQTASRKRVASAARKLLYYPSVKESSVPVLARSTDQPSEYRGSKTAGTPTLAELHKGERKGTLRLNRSEAITTPKVRKASRQLKKAQKVYRQTASPQISGLRNQAQEEFAIELSKQTGIPPKLAGEWVLQESGASSAEAGGEAGEQNQLGVGYPAHPTSFSESPYFNSTTPKKAADATAKWMEGKIGGEYDYSAADSIQGIPKLAKSGASEAEIRSYIEGPSAWGTGTIAQSGVSATPGKANPKVVKRLKVAKKLAKEAGLPTNPKQAKEAERVNYLKTFGKQVGRELKLVQAGKFDKGPGTIVPDSGVSITEGHEPEIAARLKLLSAKIGKPIYIISGYRSPQHSVEVGGFADDPHTEGEAADIGIGAPTLESAGLISEADYESVGLHRPFYPESAHEINHVQLLNNGTPTVGGAGGSTSSSSAAPSSGASVATPSGVPVPENVVKSYADKTGKSPKQVRQQIASGGLSVSQIYKRLQSLGIVGSAPGHAASAESSKPTLSELESKYAVSGV
jgi:hypothetical protein